MKTIPFYRPKENGQSPSGYATRIGIQEILPVTHAVRDLIVKGSPAEEIDKQAKVEGMLSMLEDGVFKAASGITTVEEVLRVIAE